MNERTAHMDLLDQVERDQATRDAVRRMLAQPLTERELDAYNAERSGAVERAISVCHGPCDQGRKPCRTPEACQLPEPRQVGAWDLALVVVMFLGGWAVLAAMALTVMRLWR